ncbi:MAG: ABC transporter ATP-binding protein [Myxococcota bacterium]
MSEPLLHARALTKRYGRIHALRGVDLSAHPGRVLALLGKNGAGKTTLLRILCGLIAPDAGCVRGRDGAKLHTLIGYCPQELLVWPDLTCAEQLDVMGRAHGLCARARASRAASLLDELELTPRARDLAGTLSGGLKRRLSIAMALMHDPAILVLDEPEVGLDPQSRVSLRATLERLASSHGKAVLLSTHTIGEIQRIADDVAILHQGSMLTQAPLAGVLGEEADLERVFVQMTGAQEATL